MISKIEIRSEESIDIQKYCHERKVEKIVVPFSEDLKRVKSTFLEVMIGYYGGNTVLSFVRRS